jgi:nucleotide-binding universal stress UspA family protein
VPIQLTAFCVGADVPVANLSGWQLIGNQAVLVRDEGSLQTYWLDGSRVQSVFDVRLHIAASIQALSSVNIVAVFLLAWMRSCQCSSLSSAGTKNGQVKSLRMREWVMIKDIVVNLSIGVERDAAANYAVSLAIVFKAHLVGVAFVYDPKVSANLIVGIPAELIDAQRAATKHQANDAVARFEALAKQAGVMTESQMIDVAPGHVGDTFGRLARSFDLSVIRQAEPNKAEQEVPIIEGALFESGRPVIVVPYVQTQGAKFNRVMVGWDGSRTAARAIGDAMPVLERAKMIEVFTVVAGPTKNTELPGVDIGQHLSRHGLKVEVKRIPTESLNVTEAILSHAADISADFMIMGGYGHSRLREYVLGGATRGILGSMTLPTLMSN